MKLLFVEQIKELDRYTIEQEPITSIDLMERAALVCMKRLIKLGKSDAEYLVFCGLGNNGGDGLSIARQLNDNGFEAKAYVIHHATDFSTDAKTNYERLKKNYPKQCVDVHGVENLKEIIFSPNCLIIDALLGTGTNKAASGLLAETIHFLNNKSSHHLISIDMPSGLYADKNSATNPYIIKSNLVLSFQVPKLAFLLPENAAYVPEFELLDIGWDLKKLADTKSNYYYVTKEDIRSLVRPRSKFSHKGLFGHALLLAGSKGKSGAAIIAAKACMRSGVGLLTLQSNQETITALYNHLPEAMTRCDENPDYISELDAPEDFDAIGIGPGIGTHDETQKVFKKLLQYYKGKLVIDADGLNTLSENKTWLSFLPADTILTPHPKEFERLTEKTNDDFERLKILQQFSLKTNCIIILKGAHTCIAMPDGNLFFNSSGNASLAKAGSGDALTGIILGLLARGYNPPQAALIGTFVHGFAAERCSKNKSLESILISDVIEQLPKAFRGVGA